MLSILVSCSDLIEYSPFETMVSEKKYNNLNIQIVQNSNIPDTLKFVYLSDTHNFYDELKEAVERINSIGGLHFLLVGGDITTYGLAKEYEWYMRIIKRSKVPVITGIGNHDHMSNGVEIFTKMFGKPNMSFEINGYKFCLFANTVWENRNKKLDFEWLQNELRDTLHYNIVFSHIPPWADQLQGGNDSLYLKTVTRDNTMLGLHGHDHAFSYIVNNNIPTVVSSTIEKKSFCIIKLYKNEIFVEQIFF